MYLLITSIILAVVFLFTIAFLIAYIIIYKRENKKDPSKVADLTGPLEYFLIFLIPLLFIQINSFILNKIAGISGDVYSFKQGGIVFGSILNSVLILVVAFILTFRLIFRKYDKLTFLMSIAVTVVSLVSMFTLTLVMLR